MQIHRERASGVAWETGRALLREDHWPWFDLVENDPKRAYLIGSPALGVELHRMAVLRRGPAREEGARLLVPVRLDAEEQPHWFPTFAGSLRAGAADDGTQLVLDGDYAPPMGPAGELIDRLLLHRLAESSLDSLLEQIEAGLVTGSRYENTLPRG